MIFFVLVHNIDHYNCFMLLVDNFVLYSVQSFGNTFFQRRRELLGKILCISIEVSSCFFIFRGFRLLILYHCCCFRCQMTFDFSDHIVLFCVQYIYPSMLEIFYIIHSHGLIVGGTEVTVGRTAYAIARNLYWIPLSVAILLIATSLRCMMFTILFFHNSLETVVALGVVFVFPYLFFLFGKQRNILEKEICSN